jgi:hypothetical protein
MFKHIKHLCLDINTLGGGLHLHIQFFYIYTYPVYIYIYIYTYTRPMYIFVKYTFMPRANVLGHVSVNT